MSTPNLFDFATSELSQDAFICWLASWADPALKQQDEALQRTATAFLHRLLECCNLPKPPVIQRIEVIQQQDNIDVLLLLNDDTAIIIEDKTRTEDHSNQLCRYREVVAEKYPSRSPAAVYLKTGDQCDFTRIKEAGYGCFLRDHFLAILDKGEEWGVRNHIFADFHRHLQQIDQAVKDFSKIPCTEWEREQWTGFFQALQRELADGEWRNVGHGGGGSFGFRWHWNGGKHISLRGETLRFRIKTAATDASGRQSKREEWQRRLMMKDGTGGLRIKRARQKLGGNMAVAVLVGDYLQKDSLGFLDMDGTVDLLKRAAALMDAALGGYEQGSTTLDDRS
jgi:hypothetical protein